MEELHQIQLQFVGTVKNYKTLTVQFTLFVDDNVATLSNNERKPHQRPTNIPSIPAQIQQSSLPPVPSQQYQQQSLINKNRISADVNNYNGNGINNAALKPIGENRQHQRLRNNINNNNNNKNDLDKFKTADGKFKIKNKFNPFKLSSL